MQRSALKMFPFPFLPALESESSSPQSEKVSYLFDLPAERTGFVAAKDRPLVPERVNPSAVSLRRTANGPTDAPGLTFESVQPHTLSPVCH
ncbi:hypothetical protein F2P81_021514 [Scophthalmus maximus]|uniref:Uncharacterized protein n=1 Tax=Scophthalmus maximus TaxID=52904 RepID=A0A6A4S1D2_SCOMX|nr:hypothetical protein F2P81_021514 [Scophthalmus maximus]